MLKSATSVDIFILLDDPGLRGAYVELGAFLTDCLRDSSNRRAFIVGPDSGGSQFIFGSPNYVHYCNTVDEVYKFLSK